MGFGLLFIGHVLLFFCKGIDVFPDCVAYGLMLWALIRLSGYARGFSSARTMVAVLLPVAAASDVLQILKAAGHDFAVPRTALSLAVSAGMLVMYWFILGGIGEVASDVGRKKIAAASRRDKIVTAVYVALTAVNALPLAVVDSVKRYLGIGYMILGFAWTLLIAACIWSCYMWICKPGDEEMPDRGGFLRHKAEYESQIKGGAQNAPKAKGAEKR